MKADSVKTECTVVTVTPFIPNHPSVQPTQENIFPGGQRDALVPNLPQQQKLPGLPDPGEGNDNNHLVDTVEEILEDTRSVCPGLSWPLMQECRNIFPSNAFSNVRLTWFYSNRI